MPVILFVSKDDVFKNDLISQIKTHAGEFTIIDENETAVSPDILLIDEDIDALRKYRQCNLKAPVLFLSSSAELPEDMLSAVQNLVKPFELDDFLDRLRASLNIYDNSKEGFLNFNLYQLRPVHKDIVNLRNGRETKLTEKEIAVIKYLYKSQDRIVGKNELLQNVWGYAPEATTHTIETHIYRLRQKVENGTPDAQLILTVDGGYRLKV